MASYTYSPNDCFLTIGGQILDFNSVKVESDRDTVKTKEGARGEKVFSIARANPFQKMTIKTPASSRANTLLNGLFDTQQASGVLLPGAVTNINGGGGCTIPQGMLTKKPGNEFAEESADCEWMFVGEGYINQAGAVV